ncbi:sulfurtransferase [Hahella sp. CR1]|uniref:sulfurtransferase n=1 Tax=Hahella sp. CR1 TaxID=2992807 RepID=UPI002441AEC7|nr:sulfurtransferase [Hahella sp. CR1]MDG9672016.1 sulfurtransferase [Hahella sp. CR1]
MLISPASLHSHLGDAKYRIIDCRFALNDPEYGRHAYQQDHIPGAVYADLNKDLSAPVIPGKTGRHPLPEVHQFLGWLQQSGITSEDIVVAYDDGPGAYASRLWWLLKWLGHVDVRILDGGLKAWRAAGFEMSTEPATPKQVDAYEATPDERLLVTAEELHSKLNDASVNILDARAAPRFAGEMEPIDPVAGHIPNAICAPFEENLTPEGVFKPEEELRRRFANYYAHGKAWEVICYCGSGVTACHNIFSAHLAGYPMPKLYPGSWSEWITDPNHPIAVGNE